VTGKTGGRDIKSWSVSVETAALVSVHEVATEAEKSTLGLHLEQRDGCTVSMCEAEQGIMLNRSAGLGVFEPAERGLLKWVIDQFRDRAVQRAFVAISEGSQPADLLEQAAALGLVEARAWVKFQRDASPAPGGRSELKVRLLDDHHALDWGRIVAAGFDMPESTAPLLGRLNRHPDWRLYMSFAGDQPAGAAAMFVKDGMAWFDWAATDPAFRRMGSQGAMLRTRIEAARKMGCTLLMTTTGEAVEGDPQHSWGNIGRYGFRPAFRSRNLAFEGKSPRS
jgi:GNAT superfamily N-acetyltransferase